MDYFEKHSCQRQAKYNEPDQSVALKIHQDFDNLSDAQVSNICRDILTPHTLKSLLLEYELKNYVGTKEYYQLDKFCNKAELLLNRYQQYVNSSLEDCQWTLHGPDSDSYKVSEYQRVFENSVPSVDFNGIYTETYLNNLERRLNQIATNIAVEIQNEETDNVTFIQIWLTIGEE